MKKSTVLTGLDIGTSRVSAVAARIDGRSGALEILRHATYPSKGLSRGVLADLNESVDSVSKALSKLNDKVPKLTSQLYVNISGPTIKGDKSRGMIPLSLRGREITKFDIDRCANVASTIQLPFDREIIHKIVRNFSLDDQEQIRNPLGLYASRLSCEAYIITANINTLQNIYKCINSAGYDVKEAVFTGMAKGEALLDLQEKEEGVALVDMGASLTEVSIFYGGALTDLEIIPIGAEDIVGRIGESVEFSNAISKISAKLEDFSTKGGKITSIVLTGGMSFQDGIVELLEGKLSYPIKMGFVKDVRGDISSIESIRLSGAIGLVKYACNKYEKKASEEKNLVKRLSAKVVDIFNNYF